ncbi:HAD family hydrolase [Streptomyces sp. 8N114]|uniref:HAD family hydrolase n=1 Tax=Streptomyces sp. 8N114 TaxID=3457419 RepID=UPI003FD223DA
MTTASCPLRHLRLVALNIDGVLLNDTFSPVIHRFLTSRGVRYTAELERELFSQPQLAAARASGLDGSPEELVKEYFQEREEYLAAHPVRLLDGAEELLGRLDRMRAQQDREIRLVCYGGLERHHFDRHLGALTRYFDEPGYVCTNDFRPGIAEITGGICGVRPDEALFVDDVARVAEAARDLGAAFIGLPSSYEHSFQRELMREAGVRHLVSSPGEIDEALLRAVDEEAAAGTVWQHTSA